MLIYISVIVYIIVSFLLTYKIFSTAYYILINTLTRSQYRHALIKNVLPLIAIKLILSLFWLKFLVTVGGG